MSYLRLIKLIEAEEGWKSTPYRCSEGYPTVGYGFKIGNKNGEIPYFILPKVAGDAWLNEILSKLQDKFAKLAWYNVMNIARKSIIISMAYQMGYDGVMKFKNMIKALEYADYNKAGIEMLNSRWAMQTISRATRHSDQMVSGKWDSLYN